MKYPERPIYQSWVERGGQRSCQERRSNTHQWIFYVQVSKSTVCSDNNSKLCHLRDRISTSVLTINPTMLQRTRQETQYGLRRLEGYERRSKVGTYDINMLLKTLFLRLLSHTLYHVSNLGSWFSMSLYLTLAFVTFTQIVSLRYCYIGMITKYGLFDPILRK
jgi:hypothetical protein